MAVSENVVYPIVPNGFHDHYPYKKLLFHWEYTQHFQTHPSFHHFSKADEPLSGFTRGFFNRTNAGLFEDDGAMLVMDFFGSDLFTNADLMGYFNIF